MVLFSVVACTVLPTWLNYPKLYLLKGLIGRYRFAGLCRAWPFFWGGEGEGGGVYQL